MSRTTFSRFLVSASLCALASLPAWGDSQVRIVRLSYVAGAVEIDRGTGKYEKAILNLPITQGIKLQTKDDARAEVEFEDGSTLRLAPGSSVQFSQLSLRDSGEKVSTLEIVRGTAYVDCVGKANNDLTLQFGREKLELAQSARVRIGVDEKGGSVAVFKGEVEIDSPLGTEAAHTGQTANFDFSQDDSFMLAKNIQEYPYDSWDKEQDKYHQQYSSKSYNTYSPYAYGTSDLAYYGNFISAPGYGMVWQPYFVDMGWDPFMDGAWAFAPGWGFGWVSAYPWGWIPYHYGSWVFVPGFGWAWQPGGIWTPWYAQPTIINAPNGFKPPKPPVSGTTTVVVNRGPVSRVAGKAGSKMVIRNNSAGLGVPRGGVANMARLSQQVQKRGMVTERVETGGGAPPMIEPRGGSPHGSARPPSEPRPPMIEPSGSRSSPPPSRPHR